MSKLCKITGKKPLVGNNVSKALNRTKISPTRLACNITIEECELFLARLMDRVCAS